MSNRPKIYGTCPAGCLFETIHRDEFNAAATYKNLVLENGAVNVEMLHKYKIVPATDEDSGEYALSITAVLSNGEEYEISPEDGFNYDPYHTYIFFECLDLHPSYLGYYNLIFEVDGQRYTTEIDSPDHSVDATIDHIVITGAAQVSIYSDGEIKAKDGEDGASVSVAAVAESNVDGGENVVTFTDGKTLTVKNGKTGAAGKDGKDGNNGKDGASVAVQSVTESTEDGGSNVVTFTDGKVLNVKNGKTGAAGKDGVDGKNGTDGKDGVSPVVEVFKTGNVASIQVTNADGTAQTVSVKDGESGGGDWSVNDESAAGYVKNRTHYKEVKGVNIAVLPQTSVDFDTGAYLVHGFAENSFIEGNKYIVVWNGKEYEAYCYVEDGTYVIGNGVLADMTTKTDHPFCVVSFGGSACYVYKETDTDETITIKINGVQETIYHQLDPKYIPNMYYTEERNDVEILPTSTAIDTGNAIMGELYVVGDPITLVEGKTYKVTYNGVEYECVATAGDVQGVSSMLLGDVAVLETGTPSGAYPFLMATNDYMVSLGACIAVIPLDGSTSITVSILGGVEIIHHIPPKFIEGMYYEEGELAEILPETTYDDQIIADDGVPLTTDLGLVAGNTYTVKWNGVEYTCVGQEWYTPLDGVVVYAGVALGDVGLFSGGESTGEPFVVVSSLAPEFIEQTGGFQGIILPLDGSTNVTVSIVGEVKTIHKIDNKFLDLEWLPVYKENEVIVAKDLVNTTNGDGAIKNIDIDSSIIKTVGTETILTANNTVYKGISKKITLNGLGVYYVGNLSLALESTEHNTGEAYCIFATVEGNKITIVLNEFISQEVTWSLSYIAKTPNKIPEKFLPDVEIVDLSAYMADFSANNHVTFGDSEISSKACAIARNADKLFVFMGMGSIEQKVLLTKTLEDTYDGKTKWVFSGISTIWDSASNTLSVGVFHFEFNETNNTVTFAVSNI